MEYMFAGCSKLTSLDLSSFNTASVTTMFCMFEGCSKLTTVDLSSWNTENVEKINALFNECSELTTVDLSSWNTAKVWNTGYMFYNCSKLENIYVGDGWSTTKVTNSSSMFDGCTKLLSMNTANPAIDKTNAHTGDGGYLKVKPAASSGPEVAWDKAEKTGQFTMPGGNVTLEPEYYPQATAAEGAVTAATDAKATTDAPLVTIDETKLTGATKMMYYVSTDATAPAYDAEGWTDVLPTAEKFTEAANLNVWYYPVGTDEGVGEATATYSDGDMNANALTVTIAAAPLWNAEFDLTDAPEEDKAGKWSTDIPEGGVVKGQTVTVTYSGTKKVIGVKAEKKAAGVKVTAITLNKTATTITAGQTETLSVSSVTPDDATDQTVTWSSDNEAVATVDADGKVTAVALGTANI
ncbi:MAG: BspA family leucine-rich repeat surface protein, partial [Clostridia bacterium]|nr:BspA family leucine-rich repeat surface protein [Clostridia bacterium]